MILNIKYSFANCDFGMVLFPCVFILLAGAIFGRLCLGVEVGWQFLLLVARSNNIRSYLPLFW